MTAPAVRLGDVADLSALPLALRSTAASLTIAIIPRTDDRLSLSVGWVERRAAGLMPALAPWLPTNAAFRIDIRLTRRPASAGGGPAPCAKVVEPSPAGAFLRARDVTPAPCDGPPLRSAIRYDARWGLARASRDLHVGDVLALIPAGTLARTRPYDPVTLVERVGSVEVRRRVAAVQPGPAGKGLFVAADDGQVFSASAPEIEP